MQKKTNAYSVLVSLSLVLGMLAILAACHKDPAEPLVPATANFTSSVTGLSVAFTNTTTNGKSYSWNFGDGSAASTDKSPSHTYATAGTFTVVLTAVGDVGSTPSTKTETVTTVAAGPDPTAAFTFAKYRGTYSFTNSSTNGVSYSWDFGDGTAASTEQAPTHSFTTTKTYAVKLTVTGAAGTTPATQTQSIDVVAPCTTCLNLLKGGSFDLASDSSFWSVIKADALPISNHIWGVTTGLPSHGSGGAFGIYNTPGVTAVGAMFYQQVQLTAGTYQFSADVKIDSGADASAGGLSNFYYEIYLDKPTPTYEVGDPHKKNGYSANDATGMLAGFNGWKGTGAILASDGNFPEVADGWDFFANADADGILTIEKDTLYYFLVKMGYYSGGFGKHGIVLDNLTLVKLP